MLNKLASATVGASAGPEQHSNSFPGPKQSEPGAMHIDRAGDSWMSEGQLLAQDIAVALQHDSLDTAPVSDAPSYEALCLRSQQTWQQFAASSDGFSSLSQQQVQGFQQICSSSMQLATALLCEPAVAMQLVAAGSYTAAADQVKVIIKQVCSYLLECLRAAAAAAADVPAGQQQQQQQQQQAVLQSLLPAVQATVQQLLDIALTQAAFVSGLQPPHRPMFSSQIPKELRSMAVLNLSWGNLCKILLETPMECRPLTLQPEELAQALQCSLQQLQLAIKSTQAPEKKEVLARFWLQNAQRLVTVAGSLAAAAAMGLMFEAAVGVYAYAQRVDADVQTFLEQQLQPRLITCLAVLLSCSPEDATATQSKLDCLLQTPCTVPDCSDKQQQQLMQAHLLVVLDLMQHLPTMQAGIAQQCCQQLLLWVIKTAGSTLCSSILTPALEGSALLQHVLQCCLMCVVGCVELLQPPQQQELMAALTLTALDGHPLVSFIAQQLLAELLACSSSEAAQQQLAGLLHLLASAAACCAMPRFGDTQTVTTAAAVAESIVSTLVAVLQAAGDDVASSWVSQHILAAAPFSSTAGSSTCSNSSSSSCDWLDPASCSLLSQQCSLVLRLWPSGAPVSQLQLEECLNQLWLTAQQVLELLDTHHWQQQQQQQQQSSLSDSAASEQLLVLHQLTWQLEAMQALMLLLTAKQGAEGSIGQQDNPEQAHQGTSSLAQGCTAFAVEVLKAITTPSNSASSSSSSGAGSPSAAATPPAAAAMHADCTAAALRVLAAAAHVAVPITIMDQLLQIMRAVAKQQHGQHFLLASVIGKLRISGENTAHEELFQLLLSSPHWPVCHAASASLISHLQYNNFAKTGIPKLLPASMRASPTEARPEAIDIIKGYLHKRPDTQASAAFGTGYQQLLELHSQNIAAAAASSPSNLKPSINSSSWSGKCVAAELTRLEQLIAACNLQAGGAVRPGDTGVSAALQQLMQLAATAGGSLGAVEQALNSAESEVLALMSAATTAAQGQQLSADEVMVISRKGSSMVGSCASLCSRLRALQDKLSSLKG